MRFTDTGQVESPASAYWRQRVQPVMPVAGQARHKSVRSDRQDDHGPALYVTLSPIGQAWLDRLRQESAARL